MTTDTVAQVAAAAALAQAGATPGIDTAEAMKFGSTKL